MQAHNVPMVGLGVMTLWFGWLFFNAGSTLAVTDPVMQNRAEKAIMNSILGPATAGMTCFFTRKYISSSKKEVRGVKWDHMSIMNGVLCGLVAITGPCALVEDWAAIAIGGIAPIFYGLTLRLIERLHIDDPSEAFPIHGPCGAWGIFATAFFDLENGVFYGHNGRIIGVQILGIVSIIAWDVACMLIILMPLKYLAKHTKYNYIRVSPEEEINGIDYYNHAYVTKEDEPVDK